MQFYTPSPERMLLWIVLLPIAGALINGLFGKRANRQLVGGLATTLVFLAFGLALYSFVTLLTDGEHAAQSITYTAYEWFSVQVPSVGTVPVNVRFVMDHLSGIMTVMVTGIATLIHLYSIGYMGEDPGFPRFMTYLNLFTASMLILVLASNAPLMFVGWEGVGLCSYLLIGYWWENPTYAAAGRKAFVMNRIGDFGVLIGVFLLLAYAGTFEFAEINEQGRTLARTSVEMGGGTIGISVATLASLFLFLGCTGKSAQIPLYVWLPDAMAGPTPVSALIHAATMVTAGVYLCCRLSHVFIASETAMIVIALVGTLTALLAATVALVQTQMKKILAYSTVSQLGFMFAAVGCGAFAGGMFHVFTHAFFKACLFLGAGSVMHAVHAHGDADIRYLGGLKKYMPKTHITFLVSCLAIAGFPLTSGFFSKDEILFGALEATHHFEEHGWIGWVVFVGLAIAAFMTAFYMFRLYFLTFQGEFKGGHEPAHAAEGDDAEHATDDHDHDHGHAHAEPHESEDSMTVPLIVLATGALLVGFLGLPHWFPGLENFSWWGHFLNGHGDVVGPVARFAMEEGAHAPTWMGWTAMGVGTLVGLGGIGAAYSLYGQGQTQEVLERDQIARGTVFLTRTIWLALIAGGFYGIVAHWETASDWGRTYSIAVGVLLAVFAIINVIGFVRFFQSAKSSHELLMDKWRVDEAYAATFIGPFKWIAVVAANIDRIAVDGILTWVPAQLARLSGWLVTRLQTGAIQAYTAVFVLGVAGMLWWFTSPHTDLTAEVAGASVTWTADRGPGYQYRWDFDSDGEPDTEWSSENVATHEYGDDAFFGIVAIVEAGGLVDTEALEIELGESAVPVPVADFTDEWIRAAEDGQAPPNPSPPTIRLDGGRVILRAGDALVRASGRAMGEPDEEIELVPGEVARIGIVNVRIGVRVRATVQVQSAFGNLTRVHQDVTLRVPRTELAPIARRGAL